MNFKNKAELETHLEQNGWRNIPTTEVGIRTETLTHWYKRFPEIKPGQRPETKAGIQICVQIYCPPEAPGQEMVSIKLQAEKHDCEWVKFEIYTISLQSLNPLRLQAQIDELGAAWAAANPADKASTKNSAQTQQRATDWHNLSDDGLRLRCGEMTAQEIRTVRAVLSAILQPASS